MCIQCSSKQYLFHPSIHHRFQINSTQVVIELIIHDSNNHLVYYSNNYYLFSSSSAVRRSQLDEPSQNAMEGFVIPNQPAVGLVGFYVIHCDEGSILMPKTPRQQFIMLLLFIIGIWKSHCVIHSHHTNAIGHIFRG